MELKCICSIYKDSIAGFCKYKRWDIDIVAAKKKYNELLLEYKDEIIRQINNKKVLRAH